MKQPGPVQWGRARWALAPLLVWSAPAWAHRPGLSYAEIGDDMVTLTFSREELRARVPFGEIAEARDLLASATLDKVVVRQGEAACEMGAPVLTEVSGGDPGYDETARMAGETALCFALERDRFLLKCGVATTASSAGEALLRRLQAAGLSFVVRERRGL